jgi:hypothetical protein
MDNTARITGFDKPTTKALSADLVEELRQFAASRGLTVRFAGGTVGSASVTLKLEFGLEGVDRLAEDFKRYATTFGLQPTDLGRAFAIAGRTFTITGLDLKRRARPVVVRRHGDDSARIIDVETVRRALADR